MVTIIILFCAFDFSEVKILFHSFIDWVRQNPYKAIFAIHILYMGCLVLTLPITFNHIMLGFTYSQVFKSQVYGMLFTLPVVMSAVMFGSVISFLLSRYLFQNIVRRQIQNSPLVKRNFLIIDQLLIQEGVTLVALLRLTFAPFGITNYVLGVTSISSCSFFLGTLSYVFNSGL